MSDDADGLLIARAELVSAHLVKALAELAYGVGNHGDPLKHLPRDRIDYV